MDQDLKAPSPPSPPAAPPPNPLSALRIVGILFIGMLLGTLVGGAIVYRMPKIYAVQARIEGAEHSGHGPEITHLRAELVTRDYDFENKWATSFEGAADKIQKSVHLTPDKDGVTIEVRTIDPRDARDIARGIALSLDTPVREKEMAAKELRVDRGQEEEGARRSDIVNLQELLEDQAVTAGFQGTWGELLLGPGDDAVLIELAKNEDFARRLTMIKQLIVETGYYAPPGEPIHPPNEHVTVGELPQVPVSPNVVRWMLGFRSLGILLAGLLILALMRWKPATLRPEPRAPLPAQPKERMVGGNNDPW